MYFQYVSETLSSGKITLLLPPFESLHPAHKIWQWIKRESIPPFITPAREDEFGGRKSFPAAMPQQWGWKPHLPTVCSGKTGDDLDVQIPSMEKRHVPAHTSKTTLCSSWQQRHCSSMGLGRGARVCHSPGLHGEGAWLFG